MVKEVKAMVLSMKKYSQEKQVELIGTQLNIGRRFDKFFELCVILGAV